MGNTAAGGQCVRERCRNPSGVAQLSPALGDESPERQPPSGNGLDYPFIENKYEVEEFCGEKF